MASHNVHNWSAKWWTQGEWNLKVAHNAGTGKVQVYVDNQLVLTVNDRGPATRHFKNGVYHHGSGRAEARFRHQVLGQVRRVSGVPRPR